MSASSSAASTREQTRARYPDEDGYVERDGVRVFYEVYGDGEPTVVPPLPHGPIIHSRHWKMQIPYLARHFRVLTFDGRGNGKADRPSGVAAYAEREFAEDSLAVMDATGTESAVVVGLSCGALWGTLLAADHPDRVQRRRRSSPRPSRPRAGHPERNVHSVPGAARHRRGLGEVQPPLLARAPPRSSSSTSSRRCSREPHSTKQIEDCVGWGLEMTPETLIDSSEALQLCGLERFRDIAARVRCPVLVLHGDEDAIRPRRRVPRWPRPPAAGSSRSKARATARTPATR